MKRGVNTWKCDACDELGDAAFTVYPDEGGGPYVLCDDRCLYDWARTQYAENVNHLDPLLLIIAAYDLFYAMEGVEDFTKGGWSPEEARQVSDAWAILGGTLQMLNIDPQPDDPDWVKWFQTRTQ